MTDRIDVVAVRIEDEGVLIRVEEHVADQREGGGRQRGPGDAEHARVMINISVLPEKAASTAAAPKAEAPIRSSHLRPIRSPKVPIVIRNPASRKP
jgi:hypothetical protein